VKIDNIAERLFLRRIKMRVSRWNFVSVWFLFGVLLSKAASAASPPLFDASADARQIQNVVVYGTR
jgi:hypothetical protein